MSNIFIVRPFGKNRPVIKKNNAGNPEVVFFDFDKVETELIIPAMKATGLTGGTTQRIFEPGEIKEDMFSELLLADIVIADITIHNANVFYELGIRHALRSKTTILIKCAGFDETPFDIIGYKYIDYQKDDPAGALDALIQFIINGPDSERKDSPVFNMLPKLEEQDIEKFRAVPQDFTDEVIIATKACKVENLKSEEMACMIGKLKLLMNEAQGFAWEIAAYRLIGESFFSLKMLDEGRILWERVKTENIKDLQANDRLSTIYQRLADRELKNNPVKATALLAESDLAIEVILSDYINLDLFKRAEVYALKGRNAKTRWMNAFKDSAAGKKDSDALQSNFLESAYKYYERGYYENLNHFYSGINALGLLVILISLAERLPDIWALPFNTNEEAGLKIKSYKERQQKLAVSIQFSLDAEKRRIEAEGKTDAWLNITEADFICLTDSRPARVALMYVKALQQAEDFHIEAAKKQLLLYKDLNVLTDNVDAVLQAIPVVPPRWEKIHYLLFTGHMIDGPGRETARFPASKEATVRQKILEKVKETQAGLNKDVSIVGFAGGACGGDILFHEVCTEMGIKTQLLLAMPREPYLVKSVSFAGPDWIRRFDKLYADTAVKNFELSDKEALPKWLLKKADYNIWMRNNLWQLNTALVNGGMNMTLIALWDGKGGDGPGGTQHMVEEANKRAAGVRIIDIKGV